MNEDDLRPVMLDELPALVADGIGHDNHSLIAAHRAHKGKADTLVAAGRLNDDGVGLDFAAFFAFQNHIISGSCFNGTSDVQAFIFYKYLRIVFTCHPV